jgi:YesN/AraC family two-component response regulator
MNPSPGTKPRVLFVDDEESIRLTLGLYLESEGMAVTTAATVPEALKLITQQSFDVLIADLNVGQSGDGFTVVSAMRRTQPYAVTFILTGYPAFETALEAIRLQVDDYLTKPTDTEGLIQKIRSKLAEPKPTHHVEAKRLPQIINENLPSITAEWLKLVKDDLELSKIRISEEQRKDHVPRVLQVAVRISQGEKISASDRSAASDHGIVRRKQGYSVALLIRESRLLQTAISRCVQSHLLAVQISHLISDMISIHETIEILLEESARAFLKDRAA